MKNKEIQKYINRFVQYQDKLKRASMKNTKRIRSFERYNSKKVQLLPTDNILLFINTLKQYIISILESNPNTLSGHFGSRSFRVILKMQCHFQP